MFNKTYSQIVDKIKNNIQLNKEKNINTQINLNEKYDKEANRMLLEQFKRSKRIIGNRLFFTKHYPNHYEFDFDGVDKNYYCCLFTNNFIGKDSIWKFSEIYQDKRINTQSILLKNLSEYLIKWVEGILINDNIIERRK